MVALSDSGKVFRKEDIEKMSADGVNGEFAHSGGKYDIFLYAGGVTVIIGGREEYLKRNVKKMGNFMEVTQCKTQKKLT